MTAAVQINTMIQKYSLSAKLIITNMPLYKSQTPQGFINIVNVLTQNLNCVLLVRGGGREIISFEA